jgi:hypothetical protein
MDYTQTPNNTISPDAFRKDFIDGEWDNPDTTLANTEIQNLVSHYIAGSINSTVAFKEYREITERFNSIDWSSESYNLFFDSIESCKSEEPSTLASNWQIFFWGDI